MGGNPPPVSFNAVIVGLGRAGFDLHIPILHKVRNLAGSNPPFSRVVGLVDNIQGKLDRAVHKLTDYYKYDPAQVYCATSIADLKAIERDTSVVHICTPAKNHSVALHEVAEAGFKRVIIEKPCADNALEVEDMYRTCEQYGLNSVVVNPYLYSRCIDRCKHIGTERQTQLRYLEFELSKPRKSPTLKGQSTADSVFDVELPHQIATALYLTEAKNYKVLRAEARDMHYREIEHEPCKIVPNMGLGIIILELEKCTAVLVSYLDAPTRTRVLRARFSDQSVVEAFFPVSEDDHTSEVIEYGHPSSDGSVAQQSKVKLPDDLFTHCLSDIYSKFATNSAHLSDIEFNRKVVDIMDKAKLLARVRK